jgi:hypothetical protein
MLRVFSSSRLPITFLYALIFEVVTNIYTSIPIRTNISSILIIIIAIYETVTGMSARNVLSLILVVELE